MIKNYLMYLNRIVWGPWTLFLFAFIGIFISLKLNFFQVRFFFDILRETVGQIFKKRKDEYYYDECEDWLEEDIVALTDVKMLEKKELNCGI